MLQKTVEVPAHGCLRRTGTCWGGLTAKERKDIARGTSGMLAYFGLFLRVLGTRGFSGLAKGALVWAAP